MMWRRFFLMMVAAALVGVCGCRSRDPLDCAITDRDLQRVTGALKPVTALRDTNLEIAFINDNQTVDTRRRNHQLRDAIFRPTKGRDRGIERMLLTAFNSDMDAALEDFPNFKSMTGKALDAVEREPDGSLTERDFTALNIPGSDLMIVYRLTFYDMEKEKEEPGEMFSAAKSEPIISYAGVVHFDCAVIDTKTKQPVFRKNMIGRSYELSQSFSVLPGESRRALCDATRRVVRKLIYELSCRYFPPEVTETRGEGLFARLDIGTNLDAYVGQTVEFYALEKRRGTVVKEVFADGQIVKVNSSSCWIKVNNYRTAGVKLGTFARLVNDN